MPFYYFDYSGNNNGMWIFNNHQYYIKINEKCYSHCRCSGCFQYENTVLTSTEEKNIVTMRNYKNKHCLRCKCRWCVCNTRKINRQYEKWIKYFNPFSRCECIVCSGNKYNFIDNTLDVNYICNIESIIFDIYLRTIKSELYPHLNKNVINLISTYISIDDLDSCYIIKYALSLS